MSPFFESCRLIFDVLLYIFRNSRLIYRMLKVKWCVLIREVCLVCVFSC